MIWSFVFLIKWSLRYLTHDSFVIYTYTCTCKATNQFALDAVLNPQFFFLQLPIDGTSFRFLQVFARGRVNTPTRGVPLWRLTCIHAIVSRSPWGHGWVAPDKKALEATNEFTLFVDFYPRHVPLT